MVVAAAAMIGTAAVLTWTAWPGAARPAHRAATYGRLSARAAARLRDLSWQGGPTQASDGETVAVYVSASYGTTVTPLQWANFFAGLLHGDELSAVSVYVATPAEVVTKCGGNPDVLGCYGDNTLLIPGEVSSGVAPEEIARHEYGHHVAQYRLNSPLNAIDTGPKQWATYENVCGRVANGTAFPGDEGEHYTLNPGEAWAESYRVLNDERAGLPLTWDIVDGSFTPDAGALQAVEADVLHPWTGPAVKTYRSRFTANGTRVWSLPLTTPLDGLLEVTLELKHGALDGLAVRDSTGAVGGTGIWTAQTEKTLDYVVCGQRSLTVRVTRRGTPGPFALTVSQP